MKLITLLVPAYLPRPYVGATPTPYQSGTVDQFEKALADLAPVILRKPNVSRLRPDGGRWVDVQIVTPYQFVCDPEDDTAGNAIALALKVFKLDKITVLSAEVDGEDFGAEDAANLATGLHDWNGAS